MQAAKAANPAAANAANRARNFEKLASDLEIQATPIATWLQVEHLRRKHRMPAAIAEAVASLAWGVRA